MTLIEVVLAIIILAISSISIYTLQTNLFKGTFKVHNMLTRLTAMKNMFVESSKNKWHEAKTSHEVKLDAPDTTIVYNAISADKDANLKKFNHIVIEKITARWKSLFGKASNETLVALAFVPPQSNTAENKLRINNE